MVIQRLHIGLQELPTMKDVLGTTPFSASQLPCSSGNLRKLHPHTVCTPLLQELPAVKDVLGTMRARLEALNAPDLPRLHTDRGK